MENINIKEQTQETVAHVSAFTQNQLEIYKLLFIKKVAKSSSFLMFIFISSLVILFIAFMLSISVGIYLGELIGSYPLAFLIVAGINLFLLILLFIFKKAIIDKAVLSKLLKQM